MADPLSISASIAGLVTLADIVYLRCARYIRSVKNANKEISDLSQEVNLLGGALNSLSRLARSLEDEPLGDTFRIYHIEACSRILTEMKMALTKADGKRASIQQRLTWPFSSDRVKELLNDLSRHKQSINLALSTNSMDMLIRSLANEAQRDAAILEVATKATITHQIISRIEEDTGRRKVLDFFLAKAFNPQQHYEMSLSLRHPMTGLWLVNSPELQSWLAVPGSRLWLRGMAGGGKTILAGSIIEEAIGQCHRSTSCAATFFFCDYKNDKTQHPVNILGAVTYQLAIQKEEAYAMLEEYYNDLHPQRGLERVPTAEGLEILVGRMCALFDKVYLVIDGLDECGQFVSDITLTLHSIAEACPNVSMALLSRDEDPIKDVLEEDFDKIEVKASAKDVEAYVAAQIEQRIQKGRLHIDDPELKAEILETLVNDAQGMFRWVSCQLDHLGDCLSDKECRAALKQLPPTLNETYSRILRRVPKKQVPLVQVILNFTAFAGPPLTIHQLREALSVQSGESRKVLEARDMIREDAIARLCSSLIRKSNDGQHFEFAHFSVQEFLRQAAEINQDFEPFEISESTCDRLLSIHSLQFLQLQNFDQAPAATYAGIRYMDERNRDHPFYNYAADWPLFARALWNDSEINDLAKRLFNPKKTGSFKSWAAQLRRSLCELWDSDLTVSTAEIISDILEPNFSPLHLAAILSLPTICSFLLESKANVNLTSSFGSPADSAVGGLHLFTSTLDSLSASDWIRPTSSEVVGCVATVQTIRILCDSGAKLSGIGTGLFSGEYILGIAFIQIQWLPDFSVSTELIVQGVGVKSDDITQFKSAMVELSKDSDYRELESSMPSFIRALNGRIALSPMHFDLCSLAWSFALEWGFEFARDSSWVDTRISYTDDSLRQQIISCIEARDADALSRILQDPRVRASSVTSSTGESLLHMVLGLEQDSNVGSRMVEMLLDNGCNIIDSGTQSQLPRYRWCWDIDATYSTDVLVQAFFKEGASCTWVDPDGRNVLHLNVNNPNRLQMFVDGDDVDSVTAALGMVDKDGLTPFAMSLKGGNEDAALFLYRTGAGSRETWQSPTPPSILATEANLERILEEILKNEVYEPGSDTPLHHLSPQATLSFVESLKAKYEDACRTRVDGRLPLENYLRKCICDDHEIHGLNSQVVEALTPSMKELTSQQKGVIWEYFSSEILPNARNTWNGRPSQHARMQARSEVMCAALDYFLNLGILTSFEEAYQRAGILTVLETADPQSYIDDTFWPLSVTMIYKILVQTERWSTVASSRLIVQLLKQAVRTPDLKIVKYLLDQGVSIHQRVDGSSALEGFMTNFTRYSVTPRGFRAAEAIKDEKEILRILLDKTQTSQLDEINQSQSEQAVGLVHLRIHASSAWKIGEVLKRGADPNLRLWSEQNSPAIVHQLLSGHSEAALLLLEAGADPTYTCDGGLDAALAAASSGAVEFLQTLYDTRNPAWQLDWTRKCNVYGFSRTPVFGEGNALHIAAWNGKTHVVEFYTERGLLKNIDERCQGNCTPLHVAARAGEPIVVALLLAMGADINARCDKGKLPLHYAAETYNVHVVKALIDAGSDNTPDAEGMTPFMYGLRSGVKEMVELLREADRNARNSNKTNASGILSNGLSDTLMVALEDDDIDLCKEIYELGCSLDANMSCGCYPLVYAATEEAPAAIEWLLGQGAHTLRPIPTCTKGHHNYRPQCSSVLHAVISKTELNGVLPVLLDKYLRDGGKIVGETPKLSSTALGNGNSKGLQVLLDHIQANAAHYSSIWGVDLADVASVVLNEVSGKAKTTPLHEAAILGHVEDIKFLLDLGAIVNTPDLNSAAALHLAITTNPARDTRNSSGKADENGTTKDGRDGTTSVESAGTGTRPAAKSEIADTEGKQVTGGGDVDIIRLLVDHGASIECRDINGQTPLLRACLSGRDDLVTTLLSLGANCKVSDFQKMTCLHAAAHSSRSSAPSMFRRLLALGLDPHQRGKMGLTATHLAFCNEQLVEYLLDSDLDIERSGPMPWYYWGVAGVVLLTTPFPRFRAKFGDDALRVVLDLEPSQGWSPLCQAASQGRLDIMGNLLSIGAQLEFEGSPFGSALMAACEAGSFKSVEFLVGKGAKLSYDSPNGPRSAVDVGSRFGHIVAWLTERSTMQ